MLRFLLVFAMAGTLHLLAACAPTQAYRFSTYQKGQADCNPEDGPLESEVYGRVPGRCKNYLHETASGVRSPCYDLLFAEFDDEGWLNTRNLTDQSSYSTLSQSALEAHDAFDEIKDFLDQQEKSGGRLLIVTFVHGWKHSAEVNDYNVREFRKKLLRFCELNESNGLHQRIVGIYVGWRGDSLRGPDLERSLLTFYDRSSTAQRIAQGAVHDVVAYVNAYERHRNSADNACAQSKNKFFDCRVSSVFIGHSFGGLIMFEALEPSILDAIEASDALGPTSKSIQRYGDIIVLINPAIEAARFEPMLRLMGKRSVGEYHAPLMTIITSAADTATKNAFPIGRFFGTILEHTNNPEEGEANVTAVGQFSPYITHTLTHSDESCPDQLSGEPTAKVRCYGKGNQLTSNSVRYNYFPVWNVYTDKSILSGHSDLSNPFLESFIEALWDDGRAHPVTANAD